MFGNSRVLIYGGREGEREEGGKKEEYLELGSFASSLP
jgi:hypothetical protein